MAGTDLTRRKALMLGAVALYAGLAPANPARAQLRLEGLRGALDATEVGLVPGKPDDQSRELARALTKAGESGQALFLPPGRYRVARIELPRRAHLFGVPGETRLEFSGGGFLLRARDTELLRIEGVTLDGRGLRLDESVSGLIDADGVDDLVIDDCVLTGSAAMGANLRGCAGLVERCRISDVGTVGLDLTQSRGMAVLDNVVSECGNTGILVSRDDEGGDDTIVRGNRVTSIRAKSGGTGQYGNGINVSKANGVIVAGNRIDDCDFSAIRCFSSDNTQISANLLTNSGEMAIYVEFAFEGAVVADNLIDGAAFGISMVNFAEHGGRLGVCSGNVIRNLSGVSRLPRGEPIIGTGIAAEADIAITGNVVENAARGIQLGWGPHLRNLAATGNVIRGVETGIGVSVVEGSGAALISGNLISGARKGAIVGMRWKEVATGDLAKPGAETFSHLTINGNSVS
jgi:uncharacterized secreted repeat protein (TIGR03808 family)